MNFLDKIGFSRNGNAVIVPDSEYSATPAINEELFVDNVHPGKQSNQFEQGNAFLNFLHSDFTEMGYEDGYQNQNLQTLKDGEMKIRFEAILKAQQVIESKKNVLLKLNEYMINLANTSEEDKKITQLNIDQMVSSIRDIEREIILAEELSSEKGLIMKALAQYREGFRKGCRAYADENLFGKSSNMFD